MPAPDPVPQRLWSYRGFVWASLKRDFRERYRQSLLGVAWTILNPLAMILVYTLIFSQLMQLRLPGVNSTLSYSVYLMAGIIPWGLFADLINRSQRVFLDQANLIKKVHFPKSALIAILMGNSIIHFLIVLSLFLVVLVVMGAFPGWSIVAFIPLVLLQLLFTLALVIFFSVANVFFRDVGQLAGIGVQLWFWLTPIVYSEQIVPEKYRTILELNPLLPLFRAYQEVLVQGLWPNWSSLWSLCILTIILNIVAWRFFQKRSAELVDEL